MVVPGWIVLKPDMVVPGWIAPAPFVGTSSLPFAVALLARREAMAAVAARVVAVAAVVEDVVAR